MKKVVLLLINLVSGQQSLQSDCYEKSVDYIGAQYGNDISDLSLLLGSASKRMTSYHMLSQIEYCSTSSGN